MPKPPVLYVRKIIADWPRVDERVVREKSSGCMLAKFNQLEMESHRQRNDISLNRRVDFNKQIQSLCWFEHGKGTCERNMMQYRHSAPNLLSYGWHSAYACGFWINRLPGDTVGASLVQVSEDNRNQSVKRDHHAASGWRWNQDIWTGDKKSFAMCSMSWQRWAGQLATWLHVVGLVYRVVSTSQLG